MTERPVVPLKPGNAGGGKGPQFRTDAIRSEDVEIGQPINSDSCSEAADGVTRESEGRSRVSLLRAVRQNELPARISGMTFHLGESDKESNATSATLKNSTAVWYSVPESSGTLVIVEASFARFPLI